MSMSRTSLRLLLAMCVFGFAASAHAATITYGPTFQGSYSAGAKGNFSVPQFDGSLGTLTKVELVVKGNSDGGSNGIQNLSENPGDVTLSIGSDITVTGPAALVVLTTPATVGFDPAVAAFGGVVDLTFSGADSFKITGALSTDTDSDTITMGLAPYIGLGNVSFDFSSSANTSSVATFSPSFSGTVAPTFDFTTTVTYHYEPNVEAPEPASLSLICVGAAGLFAARLRRRKMAV